MEGNYKFEQIRLYAVFSLIAMSLIYMFISISNMPLDNLRYTPFGGFIVTLSISVIFNFIRYHYINTVKYNSGWVFLIYGCIDLFYVSYYFDVPALDQGGKLVIMFILIISCIYRGRKVGIILTLLWFPLKLVSDFSFLRLITPPGSPSGLPPPGLHHEMHGFHNMMRGSNILDAFYFQIMLLVLVSITDVIYRQIENKERENKRLLNELEKQYEKLNTAHNEVELHNDKLKETNIDLENANKKLVYSVSEIFTLQQVSNAIGSILDMDELMKFVNDITLGVMGVKYSSIILFNEEKLKLEVSNTNIENELFSNSINSTVLLNIFESGTPICDNDVYSDKYIFTESRNVKSLICAPIIAKTKKYGLILIEQEFINAFDEDKRRLLAMIGQQVGIAMENAYLYREMQYLAARDNLTGAYNRMYFHEKLEDELMDAEKKCGELSVVMFDIDYFKKVNDKYGHLLGDKVLRNTAKLIKESIRSEDVFARIGGEEFIIMLPNTSVIKAYEIIEELRNKIATTTIKDNNIYTSITASFGISSFPQNSSSIMQLLKNADDALYKAKNSGRNCIKISS